MQLPNIRELTLLQVRNHLRQAGLPDASRLPETLYAAVHREGGASIEGLTALGRERRAFVATLFCDEEIAPAGRHDAEDGSVHFAFRLADGAIIESVLLPHHGRNTVCVSSQAGCPLACQFCATGRLGLRRNLAAWEIVDQVHHVRRHAGTRIDEIVFMGMGEPLLNERAVFRAAAVLNQERGIQISNRRINISTAGVVPAIHRFIDDQRPYRMLFSLGSAHPDKRRRLMPIQERYDFASFLDAVRRYEQYRRGKHVTLEYIAIRNLTMGDDDIDAIRTHLTGFRFILNVIPFNPVGDELEPPTRAEVEAFTARLRPLGFPVKVRRSGGTDRFAGCGQLGTTLSHGAR